ncbi:hypothetical protein RclHR1_01430006 [Rhizophagus clarus]|uniref:Protein kinase domain-containing protein n=1 Tax=Rhizophagus clarus TaxID=94130 RepID=A0A2Z6QC66_9GLOM|nr:hypothetical protein RclHR1_01430006 [Rhizophagus clarus]
MQSTENTNEWINWIKEAISKGYYRFYEHKYFSKVQRIGAGGFGKVYRVNWKNSEQCLALKSFFDLSNITAKEIVHELKLQRDIQFHNNIIKFYGIAQFDPENQDSQSKNYLLVMEYADSGTLKNYLKENFNNLTWDNKYNLAYQLTCAESCLHNEGIVHHDLHSDNTWSSNERSDIYSVGVPFWEISSGQQPFSTEEYDIELVLEISQGRREKPIPNTPENYIKIYTECWDGEPDNRPTINQVLERLGEIMIKTNIITENYQK